jgi:catechol 2,3-dioxygenase-like lactoylglutathione lyase family enzyme
MGIHHVALASRDVKATHAFYTGPMGFRLQKVEIAPAGPKGYAKHLFYDTGGGGMIAFWDFHDANLPADWGTAIADGLGLPRWSNHLAFDASSVDDLHARMKRILDHGHDVTEIDHHWCHSIYVNDPNDILVEFCVTTREFTEDDSKEALRLLEATEPEFGERAIIKVHKAER